MIWRNHHISGKLSKSSSEDLPASFPRPITRLQKSGTDIASLVSGWKRKNSNSSTCAWIWEAYTKKQMNDKEVSSVRRVCILSRAWDTLQSYLILPNSCWVSSGGSITQEHIYLEYPWRSSINHPTSIRFSFHQGQLCFELIEQFDHRSPHRRAPAHQSPPGADVWPPELTV